MNSEGLSVVQVDPNNTPYAKAPSLKYTAMNLKVTQARLKNKSSCQDGRHAVVYMLQCQVS